MPKNIKKFPLKAASRNDLLRTVGVFGIYGDDMDDAALRKRLRDLGVKQIVHDRTNGNDLVYPDGL